jgi:hypothetical protein
VSALRRSIDEEVDVFRVANETMKNDGEPADEDIPNALGVQRFAERMAAASRMGFSPTGRFDTRRTW